MKRESKRWLNVVVQEGKTVILKNFAARSAKDVTKLFNIGDIKGALGRFGDDYKSAFDGNVMNTPAHLAWDSIYSNRQAVAHGAGIQMTFPELKQAYGEPKSAGLFGSRSPVEASGNQTYDVSGAFLAQAACGFTRSNI